MPLVVIGGVDAPGDVLTRLNRPGFRDLLFIPRQAFRPLVLLPGARPQVS